MNEEIHFDKYETKSPDYHYKQINKGDWQNFNAYVFARYQLEIDIIDKILKGYNNKEMKILDVGCGDGALFYLFKQKFNTESYELFGIDSSEISLEVARQKIPEGHFEISEAYNLPYPDNYFELVISSDVIEHLLYPEKMMVEIKRVSKRGSYILIGTPIRYTEEPLDNAHQKEFFPKEFHDFLCQFCNNVKVLQSHLILYRELYNHPISIFKWKRLLFKHIINFLSIYLNKNVFLKIKRNDNKKYSYMFGIAKILK